MQRFDKLPGTVEVSAESTAALLRELVAHLRENRTQLREEWVRRIAESKLLAAMTREEIFAEATSVYDNYVAVLESGSVEALQAYARDLSERSPFEVVFYNVFSGLAKVNNQRIVGQLGLGRVAVALQNRVAALVCDQQTTR